MFSFPYSPTLEFGVISTQQMWFKQTIALQLSCGCVKISRSWVSQMVLVVKNMSVNAGGIRNTDLNPESGRCPGGGHGNPLQYSCLENPMDRGAWQATVHRVAKSQTQLKRLSSHSAIDPWENTHTHIAHICEVLLDASWSILAHLILTASLWGK